MTIPIAVQNAAKEYYSQWGIIFQVGTTRLDDNYKVSSTGDEAISILFQSIKHVEMSDIPNSFNGYKVALTLFGNVFPLGMSDEEFTDHVLDAAQAIEDDANFSLNQDTPGAFTDSLRQIAEEAKKRSVSDKYTIDERIAFLELHIASAKVVLLQDLKVLAERKM